MKKVFNCLLAILMLSFVFALNGCKKDQTQSAKQCDVSFSVNNVTGLNLKNDVTVPLCADTLYSFTADYAMAYITGPGTYAPGIWKTIPIFYVGGIPWTSAIQLPEGQYCLNDFVVYGHLNNGVIPPVEQILFAGVHLNATYSQYVTTPLPICFSVTSETKKEVKIDVLCYQKERFTYYGFIYFKIRMEELRQVCFFGDFCMKDETKYVGSGYDQQPNWTGSGFGDFAAIFKIDVYWQDATGAYVLQGTFTNSYLGEHVCANYLDILGQVDHYKFVLSIWVKQGNIFAYVPFQTWYFDDISTIPKNSAGFTDFVLGTCYDPSNPPVLILPQYENLPATCTVEGVNCDCINPSSLGGYMDIALSGIGPGYDLVNGTYASNCCETDVFITCGTVYNNTHVYTTLYPTMLPSYLQSPKWAKINWLLNHLDWFPGYHWYDIQGVIWKYDDWNGLAEPQYGNCGTAVPNYASAPIMQAMYNACETYGANYTPLPGGYALILFDASTGGQLNVQTMAIKLDP